MSPFRTDLGFPRTTDVINLTGLVSDEKDPILSIAEQYYGPSTALRND